MMLENRNLFLNLAALAMGLFFLQSCSDTKIMGERVSIFSPVLESNLTGNIVENVGKEVVVSEWLFESGNTLKSCQNIVVQNLSDDYFLQKKWSHNIGRFDKKLEYIATPVVYDGKVFALSKNGKLFAVDLSTGSEIFSKDLLSDSLNKKDFSVYGGLGIDKGSSVLFATVGDGQIVAVDFSDMRNPQIKWQHKLNFVANTAPIIYQDFVIVNTTNNTLYAMDKNTGKDLWNVKTLAEMTTLPKSGSVSAYDGKVFVNMPNLELYIIEIKTGKVLFADSLIGKSYMVSPLALVGSMASPVVGEKDEIVFVGNTDNLFNAVSFKNNKFSSVWTMPVGVYAVPCLNGDALFLATGKNELIAINSSNGNVIWRTDLNLEKEKFYVMGVVMVNGNIVVNTNVGKVITVNASDGKVLKSQNVAPKFLSAMIVVGNDLIALTGTGNLSVYEYK